jgi:hypothetical protein
VAASREALDDSDDAGASAEGDGRTKPTIRIRLEAGQLLPPIESILRVRAPLAPPTDGRSGQWPLAMLWDYAVKVRQSIVVPITGPRGGPLNLDETG